MTVLTMARALNDALDVSLGKDPQSWQWGRLHQAAPLHPVLGEDRRHVLSWIVDAQPTTGVLARAATGSRHAHR